MNKAKAIEYITKWKKINKDKVALYSKKYREKNKEEILRKRREYYVKNKEEILKKSSIRYQENIEKYRLYDLRPDIIAIKKIRKAAVKEISLKGKKCKVCGTTKNLQRHHKDYNYPLLVEILCCGCHHDWHRKNKPIYAN